MLMKANASSQPSAAGQTRWQRFVERRMLNVVLGLMVTTLIAAVLYPYVVITVPSGHVGVLWKRLGGFGIYCWCMVPRGTVLDERELREEGLHIIWPWDLLYIYDLRLQTMTRTYNAISKDGVNLTATINTRFQIQHDSVAQVHKFIGPDYADEVISPVIGSRARAEIAKHDAEAVYSTERDRIQQEIRNAASRSLAEQLDLLVQTRSTDQLRNGGTDEDIQNNNRTVLAIRKAKKVAPTLHDAVLILDTPVLGIELPPAVIGAINQKIEQFYLAQGYEFRVARERLEAQRKAIEAIGVRDFQRTVSQGISDSYLRWRGIEATLQLAQSPNAKIVVIGNGKDGLPIMLGNFDTSAPQPAPPAPSLDPNEPVPTSHPSTPFEQLPAGVSPKPGAPKPSDSAAAPDAPEPAVVPPKPSAPTPPAQGAAAAPRQPAAVSPKPSAPSPSDQGAAPASAQPASTADRVRSLLPRTLSEIKSAIFGSSEATRPPQSDAAGSSQSPRP